MRKRGFVAGTLVVALVATSFPYNNSQRDIGNSEDVKAATLETEEIVLEKSQANPITGFDGDGNLFYGGDPSVLVEGDTVYLYTGHDQSTDEDVKNAIYDIKEWVCYSTKDLKTWTYEGPIMNAGSDISWTSDAKGESAWASQMAKHYDKEAGKDRYYFYYCTWDKTAQGKQSIGVAVSDSPKGPFKDIGHSLVPGTLTSPQSNNWNDIDPTIWIEEDESGVEHRYMAWGNSKYYVCELNEDMISVKDLNGDGEITCGTSSKEADIVNVTSVSRFTEAPWLYRRQDENGKYYGDYYLFYACDWREKMAYATTDDLLDGEYKFGSVLMEPTTTSNTNHPAIFDFKGKTYFVYHNGSLPGGNGYRRTACITELHFNEDGTVQPIPETAAGLVGTTSEFYTNSGALLSHEFFSNSSGDSEYPYTDVKVGSGLGEIETDSQWVITSGKADKTKDSYVSIQSENKPGLYLTVGDKDKVTLAQDVDAGVETAKRQTFRTVKGLDAADGVSFESVYQPGSYLTIVNGILKLTDGSDAGASTFYMYIDQGNHTLRSIAATMENSQFNQGEQIPEENIKVTAFYADGTTSSDIDFTSDAAQIDTATAGTKTITVTYTEGEVTKTAKLSVTIVEKLSKVKNLKAKVKLGKKKNTVTLTWKKVKAADGYEVYYSKKKAKGYKYLRSTESLKYKFSSTELKKKKIYYFRVRSYAERNGKEEYSPYQVVKVKIK